MNDFFKIPASTDVEQSFTKIERLNRLDLIYRKPPEQFVKSHLHFQKLRNQEFTENDVKGTEVNLDDEEKEDSLPAVSTSTVHSQ